jgi:pilus assembly protein CpaE
MRAAFETTILDLPRSMLVHHPHLVHETQVSVVVCEFTLAATRDAIRILSWLKANAPQSRVIVVANKSIGGTGQEISRGEFEKSIERKVDVVVPFEAKAAAQAAKLGQPLAKVGGTKISQPLGQLVDLTLATVDGGEDKAAAPGSTSLLGKLGKFDVKSMLAKKPTLAKA